MPRDEDYAIGPRGNLRFCGHDIKGVDAATFERLSHVWARDKKQVYYVGKRLAQADRESFQVLNEIYAKDRFRAYYATGVIKEANAASFVVLDDGINTWDE